MATKSLPVKIAEILNDPRMHPFDHWANSLFQLTRNGEPVEKTVDVSAAEGIKVNSDYQDITIRIKSATGGAITLSANPQITAGQDNQHITIEGTSDTATVTMNTGNGIKTAGGASVTLKKHAIIVFYYNKEDSLWLEKSRAINT
jgi:hypothetical protein